MGWPSIRLTVTGRETSPRRSRGKGCLCLKSAVVGERGSDPIDLPEAYHRLGVGIYDLSYTTGNVRTMAQSAYHHEPDGLPELEQALVDIVRAGTSAAGVRQLATRFTRHVPAGVSDETAFRQAIGQALAATTAPTRVLRAATAETLPRDGESGLPLALIDAHPNVEGLVLQENARDRIAEVIDERRALERLIAVGLSPTRRVLLSGPPGVGKTMTARFLASELDLTLVTIDLASVMSSYLGRTGQNLRSALDYGRTHAALVFLDEFDALAKRRDDDSDIGELKRLVNVLLLELERWPDESLLVAATNHRHLLDGAVERRFDMVIQLDLPGLDERRAIVRNLLHRFDAADDRISDLVAAMSAGLSGSDLEALVTTAARRLVISETPFVASVLSEARNRGLLTGSSRDQACIAARDDLDLSNREIAALLGISHPTVAKALRRVGADRA